MKFKRLRTLGDIMTSSEMREIMSRLVAEVAGNVSDPNPQVQATLRTQIFTSKPRRSPERLVGQVGMAPWLIGAEAKRGPIARAVQQTRV